MKLKDALKKIYPAQGMTTVISALMTKDFSSIKEIDIIGKGLKQLEKELEETKKAQNNCGSDWAYWGYEGTISYLNSAIYILKASDIVGPDNLSDVEEPSKDGVVMDVQSNIEQFGKKIYLEALKARELAKIIAAREVKNLTQND
jgi:hypothetical protein